MATKLPLLNLYIDESGSYYIGEPRYRFFLLTAVIMSEDENNLASLLMNKWRNKYLSVPEKCFHAVDFFEDRIKNYKRHELSMSRNFNRAFSELIDIMKYINFKAEVYYIDLDQMRSSFAIKKPPTYKVEFSSQEERSSYRNSWKIYTEHINRQIGIKGNKHIALPLTLHHAFDLHSSILKSAPGSQGYINFDSQSTSDSKFVEAYHMYQNDEYKYGNDILGINLHTKGSLGGGIEIADFISYITFQTLRSVHKRHAESANISPARKRNIRIIRKLMRKSFGLEYKEVVFKKS